MADVDARVDRRIVCYAVKIEENYYPIWDRRAILPMNARALYPVYETDEEYDQRKLREQELDKKEQDALYKTRFTKPSGHCWNSDSSHSPTHSNTGGRS